MYLTLHRQLVVKIHSKERKRNIKVLAFKGKKIVFMRKVRKRITEVLKRKMKTSLFMYHPATVKFAM